MLQSAQMLKEWFNEILHTPMEPPIRLKYRSLQKTPRLPHAPFQSVPIHVKVTTLLTSITMY